MTLNHDCDNHDALIGYLYDEGEPAERTAVAAHLATCTRCAAELAGLRATRLDLAAWAPPDAQLGFRIVADAPPADVAGVAAGETASRVLRPARWWSQPMPAWAQAAAAIVIFATGAGLGALRSTQAPAPAAASAASVQTASPAPASDSAVTAQQLAQLERRLRAEMTGAGTSARTSAGLSAAPITAPSAGLSTAPTLAEVRTLIQESEQRQQRELAFRTAEVIRDFDTQRRGDLARIEQTFGQMEGNTGVQVEQQRQMLNYLLRVSQRPQ